jgi:peptidoglycan/LPS O-acetylase OafA/YrhL
MSMEFNNYTVALIGTFALGGLAIWATAKNQQGIGPQSIKALSVSLVAALTVALAILDHSNIGAAMGILGAIVGYVFGATFPGSKATGHTS